jgi:phosphoribosylformylglycinamidine cyclo-ligase
LHISQFTTERLIFKMKANAYKEAGVDIVAGDALVERIKPFAKATNRSGTMGGLGGFGALFDTKAAGFKDPILVSSTDGVGTKLRVAIDSNQHETVGIDLVAMCVNDILVQGAEPLFFLDYFASSQLNVDTAATVIKGIAEGCHQAGCALIGGETAEMPSMYEKGDYDLAGFSVGAVERENVLTGETITEADVVIGIASSGVHSNGYSLVRKIVADNKFSYTDACPFDDSPTLGHALMKPTKIYVRALLSLIKEHNLIKGLAHITGGGLTDNIPRVLPDGLGVELDAKLWSFHPVFKWLKKYGNLTNADMAVTYNCGLGMIAVVPKEKAESVRAAIEATGETATIIGKVIKTSSEDRVVIQNMDTEWTA